MIHNLQSLPTWLMMACMVAAAAVIIFIVARALKLVLWLVLVAFLAVCAVAVYHRLAG